MAQLPKEEHLFRILTGSRFDGSAEYDGVTGVSPSLMSNLYDCRLVPLMLHRIPPFIASLVSSL